jgi:hypothetical protein
MMFGPILEGLRAAGDMEDITGRRGRCCPVNEVKLRLSWAQDQQAPGPGQRCKRWRIPSFRICLC